MWIYLLGTVALTYCSYSCLFEPQNVWEENRKLSQWLGLPSSPYPTDQWRQMVRFAGVFAAACAVYFTLSGMVMGM